MNYLFILLTVLLLSIQTILFKEFNRTYMKNTASYFLFNCLFFTIVVSLFLVSGIEMNHLSRDTIVLGSFFGILFITAIFCYMKAMEIGPLSFTVLFSSFGIIIPVLLGFFFWNEPVQALQFIGLVLLLMTFYLGRGSASGSQPRISTKWLMYCLINFLGNGLIMSVAKWHQIRLPGQEIKEFLVISFSTAAILSFLSFLYYRFFGKQAVSHMKKMRLISIAVATGIVTAYGNQLIVYLASRVPSIIQFPAINGGIVIVSTLVSCILFKDKLTRKAITGMGLGIVSLVLLSAK